MNSFGAYNKEVIVVPKTQTICKRSLRFPQKTRMEKLQNQIGGSYQMAVMEF